MKSHTPHSKLGFHGLKEIDKKKKHTSGNRRDKKNRTSFISQNEDSRSSSEQNLIIFFPAPHTPNPFFHSQSPSVNPSHIQFHTLTNPTMRDWAEAESIQGGLQKKRSRRKFARTNYLDCRRGSVVPECRFSWIEFKFGNVGLSQLAIQLAWGLGWSRLLARSFKIWIYFLVWFSWPNLQFGWSCNLSCVFVFVLGEVGFTSSLEITLWLLFHGWALKALGPNSAHHTSLNIALRASSPSI